MSTALAGATITTAWKVTVKAAALPTPGASDYVEYVAANGTTDTGATGLAQGVYRTDDGKYVTVNASQIIEDVKSDITISSATQYRTVTLPDNGALSGVQYTVEGNDKAQYVAENGTITVKITLNGTGDGTTIKLSGTNATADAIASVTPISGNANGFTAEVTGNQLVITTANGKTVSGLTYAVTFKISGGDSNVTATN